MPVYQISNCYTPPKKFDIEKDIIPDCWKCSIFYKPDSTIHTFPCNSCAAVGNSRDRLYFVPRIPRARREEGVPF